MQLNWGWRIAIVYTVFALGTLGFVGFALTREVDLVRPDYYEHSLRHDETMASRARAQSLRPGVSVHYDAKTGRIVMSMPGAMVGASVRASLYHASSTTDDIAASGTVDQQGTCLLSVGTLRSAPWNLTLRWQHGGQWYEVERSFTVR